MRNPDKHVRKRYLELLGGVTSGSVPVPIYDRRIPVSVNPLPSTYILVSSQSKTSSRENKCGHSWDCDITLDIVTMQHVSFVNSAIVEDIEEQISDIIDTWTLSGTDITIPPFVVYHTTFINSQDFELENETSTQIRKVVRYQHVLNGI